MTPQVRHWTRSQAMRDSDRHGEGGRMSVTEQDRLRADRMLSREARLEDVEAVAAALADERDRARAPFLAVIEEWAGTPAGDPGLAAYTAMRQLHDMAEDPQ